MGNGYNCVICSASLQGKQRKLCGDRGCRREMQRLRDKSYDADGRKKRRNVKHRYGIEIEDYESLLEACGGVCEACGYSPPETGGDFKTNLHLDHDHQTGRIRGFLCHSCNLALGYAKEDETRLMGLVYYVITHCSNPASKVEAVVSKRLVQ